MAKIVWRVEMEFEDLFEIPRLRQAFKDKLRCFRKDRNVKLRISDIS